MASKLRKTLWWILVIFFAGFITYSSSLIGTESSDQSQGFTLFVLTLVTNYENWDLTMQQQVLEIANEIIRALAHIIEFCALGFALGGLTKEYNLKNWHKISFAVGFVYAIFDETYQKLFSPGRDFQIIDLLKDWFGIILGLAIIGTLSYLNKKYKEFRHD